MRIRKPNDWKFAATAKAMTDEYIQARVAKVRIAYGDGATVGRAHAGLGYLRSGTDCYLIMTVDPQRPKDDYDRETMTWIVEESVKTIVARGVQMDLGWMPTIESSVRFRGDSQGGLIDLLTQEQRDALYEMAADDLIGDPRFRR